MRGQALAEYALILALILILAIGALSFFGGRINGTLSTVGSHIQTIGQQAPPPATPTPTPTPAPTPTPPLHHVGDPCSPPPGGTWHLLGNGNWVCNKS